MSPALPGRRRDADAGRRAVETTWEPEHTDMHRPPVDRRLQWQIIFAFMTIYAVLLFATRADPTRGQVIFRVAMAALGIVGFGLVSRR